MKFQLKRHIILLNLSSSENIKHTNSKGEVRTDPSFNERMDLHDEEFQQEYCSQNIHAYSQFPVFSAA